MGTKSTFFEREIDHTPYTSFAWVGVIVAIVVFGGGYGLWHVAGLVKAQSWYKHVEISGDADNLLNPGQDVVTSAVQAAQDAANNTAQKQEDAAKAAATQALLNQKNAAVSGVQSAASSAAANVVQNSTNSAQSNFQQYINQ